MNTLTTAVTVYLVMSAVITAALCGLIHMSRRREANLAHRAAERVVTRLRVAPRPSEARGKSPAHL